MDKALVPIEIKNLIYHIRGKAVMLDSDLAILYKVDTRSLNQAVRRNLGRFPEDFMFQLTPEEQKRLISQFVISKIGRGDAFIGIERRSSYKGKYPDNAGLCKDPPDRPDLYGPETENKPDGRNI